MVTFADMSAQADPIPAIPAMSSVWEPFGRAQANIVAGADPASTVEAIRAGDDGARPQSSLGI